MLCCLIELAGERSDDLFLGHCEKQGVFLEVVYLFLWTEIDFDDHLIRCDLVDA